MSYLPFRYHHLHAILQSYATQTLPLDLHLHRYFRAHKALGCQDRGFIAETIYGLIRWQGLIDYLTDSNSDWKIRLEFFLQQDLKKLSNDPAIPLPHRISFPEELFQLLVQSHGIEKAIELCRVSNVQAPTTIRVNTLLTTREKLYKEWENLFDISPCQYSPDGLIFHKKINFFGLEEFKAGLFEVQDEGSQLLAQLVKPLPGDQVLDYCSGSGGKTLAFAPQMQSKGQIFLHDVRAFALDEARKRLKRARIQNAQIVHSEDLSRLKKLKKKMDWVLVDAPCSGTGTLRRNPDMKWRFDQEMLIRLVGLQRQIFEKALSFLKPEGKIVYGTCSMLKEENQHQLEHFVKTYDLKVVGEPFESLPSEGGMDGFFGVVLEKNHP
ncbi:MAG: RsmB/NOP family class I SAM-dependent RNA methyltransferase [Parachlamydiaceae bacterium]